MIRIVQRVRLSDGVVIDQQRVDGFGTAYFSLLRRWEEDHGAGEYTIRTRPRMRLQIDFSRYQTDEGT